MKKIILLPCIFLFAAFSYAASGKITEAMYVGAVTISDETIECKEVRSAAGGKLINMDGVVPFDIKREQLKPTIMLGLKRLLIRYPDYKEIHLALIPDRDFREAVVRASYLDGTVKIYYGIPSDEVMKKKNADIGKSMPGGIFGDDKKQTTVVNHPRLYRPDEGTFKKLKQVNAAAKKIDDKKMDWRTLCSEISATIGMPLTEVEQIYWLMEFYYASGQYGEELVKL